MPKAHRSLALVSCAAACVALLASVSAMAQEACFERLDNGVDLTGWSPSATNMHGPGQGWTVEDGAIVGRQTGGQQGGILMTDASYQDVEVIFEVKIDWGCDSGFFFRTTDGNRAYQVTIDHVSDSAVGTIWGEAFPQELREIPYLLTDNGNTAVLASDRHEEPIFDLALWSSLWEPTAYNEIRARVEDNPPHIQVWISGTQVMDFTETIQRDDVNASGPLAIQVHGGSRWIDGGTVAFRNIRVRDLALPCDEVQGVAGGGGQSSQGTGGRGGQPEGGAGGVSGAGGVGVTAKPTDGESMPGTGGMTSAPDDAAGGTAPDERGPAGVLPGNPGDEPTAETPGAASGAPTSSPTVPPSTPATTGTGSGGVLGGSLPPQGDNAGTDVPSHDGGMAADGGVCDCRVVGRVASGGSANDARWPRLASFFGSLAVAWWRRRRGPHGLSR